MGRKKQLEGQISFGELVKEKTVVATVANITQFPSTLGPILSTSKQKKKKVSTVVVRGGTPHVFTNVSSVVVPTTSEERLAANVKAIKLVEALDIFGDYATEKQQLVLSSYTGWEGLLFDKSRDTPKDYKKIKDELISLFGEKKVKGFHNTSFYPHHITSSPVSIIEKVMKEIGFESGNLLLTGTGAGNMVHHFSKNIREKSKITISATDTIQEKITSYLFPDTSVLPYNKEVPQHLYDMVVGVIPYEIKKKGQLIVKNNTIPLPRTAASFGTLFNALRIGGYLAVLIESQYLDGDFPINFPLTTLVSSPTSFIGGLRLDNAKMGNDVAYDLLVYKKEKKLSDVRYDDTGKQVTLSLPVFGTSNFATHKVDSYFSPERQPFYYSLLGETAYCKSNGVANGYSLYISPLNDTQEKEKTSAAIESWECKKDYESVLTDDDEDFAVVLADSEVKNYQFVILEDGFVYQRVESQMIKQKLTGKRLERVIGMIEIREHVKRIYELQIENCSTEELEAAQQQLTVVYDQFVKDNGFITDSVNVRLMREDADFTLLTSIERKNSDDETEKSDVFFNRTVMLKEKVVSCDSLEEAFFVSFDRFGEVNFEYIASLTSLTVAEVKEKGYGDCYFTDCDTYLPTLRQLYLSGDVRNKLVSVELCLQEDENNPKLLRNKEELEKVLPPFVPVEDIGLSIGVPFISHDILKRFLFEVVGGGSIGKGPNSFSILTGKTAGSYSVKYSGYLPKNHALLHQEYGIKECNAFVLTSRLLSNTELKVKDKIFVDGVRKYVDSLPKTLLLNEAANRLQEAFRNWAISTSDVARKVALAYNEKYNSFAPPKYDGSFLTFPNMTTTFQLMPHQKNAVFRGLVEKKLLLSHVVGSGKTAIMIATGMEMLRLGMIQKPIFLVPNALLTQWGGEFMRLYPTANVLLADPADMRKQKRERFITRMMTGDYDAIILGSSSFEQIPPPYRFVDSTIDMVNANEYKRNGGFVDIKTHVKKMKFFKRSTQAICDFEELGCDFLFVDESHSFKNLKSEGGFSSVRGITNTSSSRSEDMYYKTKYLSSLYEGGGGYIFGTGTAIVNSVSELYTQQRLFQEELLHERGIYSLKEWLSVFAETTFDWELPPEGLGKNGTGFRLVQRVTSFVNLPELMGMVSQFMDVVGREAITLPLPDVNESAVICQMSEEQKEFMASLVERAEAIRQPHSGKTVWRDNMLSVTVDGRKSALDMRTIYEDSINHEDSKASVCADTVYEFYTKFDSLRATQLVFSDLSTPSSKGFSIYRSLKSELIVRGIPENEIAFAHDFETEAQKTKMRLLMQAGILRVLIGSTARAGQGLNVQNRLIALHNLDVPWVPEKIEQRLGRIVRPNNMHPTVYIRNYVTEGSFDAYMWQLIEKKSKIISQLMKGDYKGRTLTDYDTKILGYAEMKALATGNTDFLERAKLEGDLLRLETLWINHNHQRSTLTYSVKHQLPDRIEERKRRIPLIESDVKTVGLTTEDIFTDTSGNKYDLANEKDRTALTLVLKPIIPYSKTGDVCGTFRGLSVIFGEAPTDLWGGVNKSVYLQGEISHVSSTLSASRAYDIMRTVRVIADGLEEKLSTVKNILKTDEIALEVATETLSKEFEYSDEIKDLKIKLSELATKLSETVSAP